MSVWPENGLHAIVEADDLHIAPFRKDGETLGTPTWIGCVAVDGDLYVRAYNGTDSSWYQAATRECAGQITAAGDARDVAFVSIEDEDALDERIDEAYRDKYSGSPYVVPMVSKRARRATVRVVPK